jgi:hypothetical protein
MEWIRLDLSPYVSTLLLPKVVDTASVVALQLTYANATSMDMR